MSKLWGGRFEEQTNALVHRLNASLPVDGRLFNEDIDGSIAWARALEQAGVLTGEEAMLIQDGLERVRAELEEEPLPFGTADEDIHSLVERRLTELIGSTGGKLHTGRSRNDQIATDFRLWIMRAVDDVLELLLELQTALLESAESHLHTPMPGYTHLQQAQPVTWGHWLLSYFWPLRRDADRFTQARTGASVLPLGSAALAGTAYAVDRQALARTLGFARISENSIDAVSDRDFAVDFLYASALLGVHLSRLAEQLIIFSSIEFGFVTLSDAYSTGSSIMPQKKNPDTLELTRGKSGRLVGNLVGLLMTLKGLPSAYDKDLQEDKEPVFDAYDSLALVLPVLSGTIRTLTVNEAKIQERLDAGLFATELADYLAGKDVPFREAHEIVGQVVRLAESDNVPLDALDLAALQSISDQFQSDVLERFDVSRALGARAISGGTGALEEQLEAARAQLISTE
jgi:argininosuccinate lyase